jgi:hypothetical protein
LQNQTPTQYQDDFVDWNNLIESVTKPIMKLNSQLTQCLWMKLKELIKKEKKVNLTKPAN